MRLHKIIVTIAVFAICISAGARSFNDKLQNRPYADMRPWHLGFSVGLFAGDLIFSHNGYITDDGQEWRMEQANYQPGFCVNGLFDLRLNNYFSIRFSPGMYFGSHDISFVDLSSDSHERQNLKTTYVVLPLELKYAAMRWRNARPYIIGGIVPAFDVGKKRSDYLQLNTTNIFLSVGFGFEFYLPYFNLVPELKFCFGLGDTLNHERTDLTDNPDKYKYTQSLAKTTTNMVVLTFYFE